MPGVLSDTMINYVLLALNMPTAWFNKYFFTLLSTVKFINKHTTFELKRIPDPSHSTPIILHGGQDVVSNSVVFV